MKIPSAELIRHSIRRGLDTVEIARRLNNTPDYKRSDGRVWREADVWNILAVDEAIQRTQRVAS